MKIVILPNLGQPNRNGRIYTKEVLEKVIAETKQPIYGTIGIPDSIDFVPPEKASHYVENLRIEENDLVGDVVVLRQKCEDLKMGDDVAESFWDSASFRPAGYASLNENVIQDDYRITSIDVVEDPA